MSRRAKSAAVLVVILVILSAGCLYLVSSLYLPTTPSSPYFSSIYRRLPQLHWLFGQFQPVFLYPFASANQIPNYVLSVEFIW